MYHPLNYFKISILKLLRDCQMSSISFKNGGKCHKTSETYVLIKLQPDGKRKMTSNNIPTTLQMEPNNTLGTFFSDILRCERLIL